MTAPEPCRVCGSQTEHLWSAELIGESVGYYECTRCSYVQTQTPHWLDKAYAQSINDTDTGILVRNTANVDITLATLCLLGKLNDSVVDYAGGYGILVRQLRDVGVNALWSDKYSANLLAQGFEHRGEAAALVTAFEAFEHFVDPLSELQAMLAVAPSVLISTTLIPTPTPAQDQWWYYGTDHGQHIGFFRQPALAWLAQCTGRHLISDGRAYHLFTDQPLNAWLWRKLIRRGTWARRLAQRKLSPLTWADHTSVKGRK